MAEFVGESCDLVKDVCEGRGLAPQVWLQGYKTPAGREQEMVAAVELMVDKGIRDIAVWGFKSCAHMSYIAPERPAEAWAAVKEAYRKVRARGDL